jgi:hypothetical protein
MSDAISEGRKLDGSYQWASKNRSHGMPTPEELEAQGYTKGPEHPLYKGSFLMVKKEA